MKVTFEVSETDLMQLVRSVYWVRARMEKLELAEAMCTQAKKAKDEDTGKIKTDRLSIGQVLAAGFILIEQKEAILEAAKDLNTEQYNLGGDLWIF